MATKLTATPFSMSFDFTSAANQQILAQLQQGNFQLLAYRGATGPNQVSAGLPTWFAVSFGDIFGKVDINYIPKFKIYAFNQATIAANTTIQMQSLSDEVQLGTALNFTATGAFTSAGSSAPQTLTLVNQRPAGSPNITVGLAGEINLPSGSVFLPFCAFTLAPLNSITMAPTENVALMAAQVGLQSGNVQANASAPGCSFSFDDTTDAYDLQVLPSSFTITNLQGTPGVNPLSSLQALKFLNS